MRGKERERGRKKGGKSQAKLKEKMNIGKENQRIHWKIKEKAAPRPKNNKNKNKYTNEENLGDSFCYNKGHYLTNLPKLFSRCDNSLP